MPPIERLYGSTDCARRREEEGRTVGEASVCGGFSGAAWPAVHDAGGGWRMVRDSNPRSMRLVSCLPA
ncbi:hypothetical protein BIFADO_01644 [Bifidobacterium adolescentis L2-32]|uniref:Uncharacterized protein n=1 Tax=Bifidobacterium adolescentis L2-32 TaxID=411481 RepID=A7A709_BIFAD|nr:hypothetical protein BIFADO_01644 [Bifidobacterium adolescentis L2-32]